VSSLLEDHRVELMAWICRLLFSVQDFKQWCCRIFILFVLYNTVSCLFVPRGYTSGSVRGRRIVLTSPAKLVERVKRLPLFYSGYAVAIVSCYIALIRSNLLDIFGHQIDFSLFNQELSLYVANFKYGTATDVIQPPPRLSFWRTQLR